MTEPRQDHFYEGTVYHLLIDPLLARVRRLIRTRVPPQSTLLDVGCGTGELLLSLADRCASSTGIETSGCMARYAARRTAGREGIRIAHGDGARLPEGVRFDIATAVMVLHEMDEAERLPVLDRMRRAAHTLLLVDYAAPLPGRCRRLFIRTIERLAGRRHYTNFASYQRAGGLPVLLAKTGLDVRERYVFNRGTFLLIVTGAERAGSRAQADGSRGSE